MGEMNIKAIEDGEWVYPKMHNYVLQCCDCGLQHEMDFAVFNEKEDCLINGAYIAFRAYRKEKTKPKKRVKR